MSINLSEYVISMEWLKEIYGLKENDTVELNKEALCSIYNCSDIDALSYMYYFLNGELKKLCEQLIILNNDTELGWGDEEVSMEDSTFYFEGKWKLLTHFGLSCDLGDACIKDKYEQTMKEFRQEVCDYIESEYFDMPEPMVNFYLRCKESSMHYADADRYAILCTIFQYDVGMENARTLDNWLYEHNEEIYEMTSNPVEYKDILIQACEATNVNLDFNHFRTEPINEYTFF